MYELGLLTHVVEEEPQSSIMHAIGHTVGAVDDVKAVQMPGVDASGLSEILDMMHVFDDELTELNNDDDELTMEQVIDKTMIINPAEPVNDDLDGLPEFRDYQKEIEHCFGAESVEECKQRLTVAAAEGHTWASEALETMKKLNEGDLKVSQLMVLCEGGSVNECCRSGSD